MKAIMMAKKFRYVLVAMAIIGCSSAFAADIQPQDQTAQNGYAYCQNRHGHGGHHGNHDNCNWQQR